MSRAPQFVVVGNVNQGKSSVVAALSENETIPIDSYPGTTSRSGAYVFKTGERELFTVVDTPGFQRAREVLLWLQQHASNAAERPRAVRAFVAAHAGGPEFVDEVELLRPVIEGAGILYVVDASSHLEPASEAEMEILRWTGQPAMALINRVRSRDHSAEWRPVLQQYFHIVREFNAHGASFADRVALLRGFRELRSEWSAGIDAAVAAMEREWDARRRQAVTVIAELCTEALQHIERVAVLDDAEESKAQAEVQSRYRDAQRKLEARARDAVERIYRHPGLRRNDPELEPLFEDLFAESTWSVFGLTQTQLAGYGAIGGALLGGGIDAMLGGLSFFAVTAVSAGLGAVAGWFGGKEVARVWSQSSSVARTLWPGQTGRFVAMGPAASARYAWVLLDRALAHHAAVRDRSHARRDGHAFASRAGIAAGLPERVRDRLDRALRAVIQAAASGKVGESARAALVEALGPALGDGSAVAGRESGTP